MPSRRARRRPLVERTDGPLRAADLTDATAALRPVHDIACAAPLPVRSTDGRIGEIQVVLTVDPYGDPGLARIADIRHALSAGLPPTVKAFVGGDPAVQLDTKYAADHDLRVVVPLVLAIILLILAALLRALVALLYLIGTVIASFFGAFGISVFVFRVLLHQQGISPVEPTFAFLFLVALGVDYNIFLMARVREETRSHDTRTAVAGGLRATGSVITSVGVILAGTFAVLMVLMLVMLFQLGFTVCVGVLLDIFLVRTALVPAITHLLGDRGVVARADPAHHDSSLGADTAVAQTVTVVDRFRMATVSGLHRGRHAAATRRRHRHGGAVLRGRLLRHHRTGPVRGVDRLLRHLRGRTAARRPDGGAVRAAPGRGDGAGSVRRWNAARGAGRIARRARRLPRGAGRRRRSRQLRRAHRRRRRLPGRAPGHRARHLGRRLRPGQTRRPAVRRVAHGRVGLARQLVDPAGAGPAGGRRDAGWVRIGTSGPAPTAHAPMRTARVSSVAAALTFAMMIGTFFAIEQYLQQAVGYGALTAVAASMVLALFIGVASPVAGRTTDRYGERASALCGFLTATVVFGAYALLPSHGPLLIPGGMLLGFALGLLFPATSRAALNSVPDTLHGRVSAQLSAGRLLGAAAGVALAGLSFRHHVTAAGLHWTLLGGAVLALAGAAVVGVGFGGAGRRR